LTAHGGSVQRLTIYFSAEARPPEPLEDFFFEKKISGALIGFGDRNGAGLSCCLIGRISFIETQPQFQSLMATQNKIYNLTLVWVSMRSYLSQMAP